MLQDTGLQGQHPQASFSFKNSPVTTPNVREALQSKIPAGVVSSKGSVLQKNLI